VIRDIYIVIDDLLFQIRDSSSLLFIQKPITLTVLMVRKVTPYLLFCQQCKLAEELLNLAQDVADELFHGFAPFN